MHVFALLKLLIVHIDNVGDQDIFVQNIPYTGVRLRSAPEYLINFSQNLVVNNSLI